MFIEHLSGKLGINDSYRQRRADARKHVQNLINQLDTVEGSLADVETDVRTNQIDTTIYERVKAKLTIQRENLLEDIEQAQMRHDQLKDEDQWLSALLNLTIDAERFDRDFSDKKKRDWLSKIVEKIDVFLSSRRSSSRVEFDAENPVVFG